MTAEQTAGSTQWADMEPYAQLVGALLPRAAGISLFDAGGEIRWTSEESVDAALPSLVRLSVAAAASRSSEAGERVMLGDGAPVHLFWLRNEQRDMFCIVAITWRGGDGDQRSFAFVHGLLRPLLEVLRRELLARARVEHPSGQGEDRDRDLDVLLFASTETELGAQTGDEIRGILQNTTNHLHCEFSALIMPERNLVVIRTAEGRKVDTSCLSRVHRHLLSLAQVRGEPTILNSSAALPGVNLSLRVLSCPVRGPTGRPAGVLALFRAADVAEFRERDAQLADLLARRVVAKVEASFDSLSGLLTRTVFEHRARAAMLARQNERGLSWSGLYIDTDRMHVINDNYGMHVGDRLIAKLGELIRSRLVPGALAARISGDRFAILLPSGPDDAMAFAEALRVGVAALNAMHLGASADANFSASVSIGVATMADPRVEFSHAFAVAETACKAAKDRGRNRVELYQSSDLSIMRRYEDINIAPTLSTAIRENRMRLDAQLIVPLDSQHNVPHFEILLRMIDDHGDTVGPDRFMSAAVRYQLMPTVDRWVLQETLRQLQPHAELLATRPVVFTINLSGQSLNEPDFTGFLVNLVRDSGLNPRLFCFEITESAAIANLAKAEELMRRMRTMGCEFALDDFGTGLSSLAYLRSLPVNMLKIDGSFVRDILKDPRAESMVQAIAHLSRSMNLVTVAEYVETDEIRLRVAALGVDYGQGFAIARPVPLTEVVLELPMYSRAALCPDEASATREIDLSGEDLEETLDAMAAALPRDPAGGEELIGADDDTQRRLEIILGDYDHSESILYQKAARS
ncbi:MAG: EAL domain-containing protein [Steroidobacteraceae bacterium]